MIITRWFDIELRQAQQAEMSSHMQFKGTDEPVYCTHFGCGKVLKPAEQLAGSKCTDHMKTETNIFKHYKL